MHISFKYNAFVSFAHFLKSEKLAINTKDAKVFLNYENLKIIIFKFFYAILKLAMLI